jgi:MFS family permease
MITATAPRASHLRKNLNYSSTDAFFSSLMVGSGETLLPAFAIALGMGGASVGLFATIPFLVGSSFQLASRRLSAKMGSYKKFCVTASLLQALSFFPLAYFGYVGKVPELLVFFVATLYWGFGIASGPVWASWMGVSVPKTMRARYFAFRNKVSQIGLLAGILGGGYLLDLFKTDGHELLAFSVLFLIAGTARFISLACLRAQGECSSAAEQVRSEKRVSSRSLVRRATDGDDGKLFAFLLSFQVAMNFSAPFFTPLLLKHLHLSYASYITLIATSFAAKVILFPYIGSWCQKFGGIRPMRWGTLLYALCPVLYILSPNLAWLIFAQIVSGAAGALYDLGSTVATYNTIQDQERTSFLSKLNFANAVAMFAGSYVGAQVLTFGGESHTAYVTLFLFGATARFASVGLLDRIGKKSPAPVPFAAPTASAFEDSQQRETEGLERAAS